MSEAFIVERESRQLEYKQDASDFTKIAKTVIAFANGTGGEIIIGIEDKSLEILGLSPNRVDELFEKLPVSIADQIHPTLQPFIFIRNVQGKELLVIRVSPSPYKPHYLRSEGMEKGLYVRIGSHTRRADEFTLNDLQLQKIWISFDGVPMPYCTIEELEYGDLPLSLANVKGLQSLGLIINDPTINKLVPTRGGILMLHQTPQKFFPEAYIILSRLDGIEGRKITETQEILGPIPAQSEICMDKLTSWLSRDFVVQKHKLQSTRTLLPLEAVREAVNNALLHRQYSIQGPIKIALFDNRLEIFSPGHFAGPFIEEALGDGTSYIRNHHLSVTARRLGLCEKRGSGIKAIKDLIQLQGLMPAKFEEGPNWFKVTLFTQSQKLQKESDKNLDDPITDYLKINKEITSSMAIKLLGVSKATALKKIEELVRSGKIVKKGNGPSTKYYKI